MNKVTLSSVKDVIPDIGGNFQLDPNVIASKATSWLLPPCSLAAEIMENFRKAPKFFERAVTGPHFGLAQLV